MKIILLALLGVTVYGADLAAVKAEPKLDRRSELALLNADKALVEAKGAWRAGDMKIFESALDEIRDSVDVCLAALRDIGRPPYKLVRWYKNAELKTRMLNRSLDALALEVSMEDRQVVQKVDDHIKSVHEELLLAALSGKK